MANRFNYRCPKCGSQDHITICAFASVRLTSHGTEGDVSDLGPDDWTSGNAAGVMRAAMRVRSRTSGLPLRKWSSASNDQRKIDPEAEAVLD
jgi:hypothetical protein